MKFLKFVLIIAIVTWILIQVLGCASSSQVSCYSPPAEKPIYQGEVRVISKRMLLEPNGNLKTINGVCLHDHPGFWNRMTFGLFDPLERGQ
jgi:hypothetical protein